MKHSCKLFQGILLLLLSSHLYAQDQPDIIIHFTEKKVFINQASINKQSSIAAIRKALGSEDRVLSEANNSTRLFIYDKYGLDFVIDTAKSILHKLTIHFSEPRQRYETSPVQLFKGKLSVGIHPVLPTEQIDTIIAKTKIFFTEWSPGFYWYSADNKEFSITIAYKDKRKEIFGNLYVLFIQEDQ